MKSKVATSADDTVFSQLSKTREDCEELQRDGTRGNEQAGEIHC